MTDCFNPTHPQAGSLAQRWVGSKWAMDRRAITRIDNSRGVFVCMRVCVCSCVHVCVCVLVAPFQDRACSALAAAEYGPFAGGKEGDDSYAPIDRTSLTTCPIVSASIPGAHGASFVAR